MIHTSTSDVINLPRIAICFSGQPRSWQLASKTWSFLNRQDIIVDTFCHVWTANTPPAQLSESTVAPIPVSNSEINDLVEFLRPTAFMVEDPKEFVQQNQEQAITNPAHLSQLYGIAMSNSLKRSFETQENILYDAVMRCRYDLFFECDPLNDILHLRDKVMCGFNLNNNDPRQTRISDYCWLADSLTADRISDLYLDIPSINSKWFSDGVARGPEYVLFYHIKRMRLIVKNQKWKIGIMRTNQDYLINDTDRF